MKILITGANGFVGSALMTSLTRAGHKVTALVRSMEKVSHLRIDGVEWIEGDLLQPEKLPSLGKIDKAF